MRAGEAVAGALLAYFRSRVGTSSKSVRLLVADLPTDVQDTAARALIRQATKAENGTLSFRFDTGELELNLGRIQSADDAARELLMEGSFEFGTSPDFPVALRNRREDTLLFCPPTLLEACHESIKSNTFQRFEQNRRFGTQKAILHELFIGNGLGELAEKLTYVADEKLRQDRETAGEHEWERTWSLIEATFSGQEPDLREIGLLPSESLSLEGTGTDLRNAVRSNVAFQRNLVEGLAQGQQRYLANVYGDRASYPQLVNYLARFDFRLRHDESSWRKDWPLDLNIDGLQKRRRAGGGITIAGLEIVGATSLNGLQVVSSNDLDVRWRARGQHSEEFVDLLLDSEIVETVPLDGGQGTLRLTTRGVQRIELRGTETPLRGETSALIVHPPSEGLLVVAIGGGTPGASSYHVMRNEPFQVRWWMIPHLTVPEQADVYLVSGSSGPESDADTDDRLETVTGGRTWLEVEDGLETPGEVLVEARLSTGETFQAETRVELRDPERAPKLVGSIGRAIAKQSAAVGARLEASDTPSPRVVNISVTPEGFLVTLEGEKNTTTGSFRLAPSELLDLAQAEFLSDPRNHWPRIATPDRTGRTVHWGVEGLSEEHLPGIPSAIQELHDAFLASRESLFKELESAGGVGSAELVELREDIELYAASYADLMDQLSVDGREVDRYASFISMTDSVLVGTVGTSSPRAVLLGPTHPLRLSWLLQYEQWIRDMLSRGAPWAPSPVATLDSSHFPTFLVDWNRHHFRGTTTAVDGTWLVLVPEEVAEIDRVIPADLGRVLRLDSPRDSMAVSAGQLAVAIQQYHDLHPLKDVLRVAYIGAGTAERLREALETIISKPGQGATQVTRERLRVELELLDVADEREDFDYSTGKAFGNYAEEDPDPDVLRRVTFSVSHLETEAFLDESQAVLQPFHLLFGTEMFRRQGRTDPLGRAVPPLCRGLLLHTLRTLDYRENPVFRMISALPPAIDDSVSLSNSMHRIAFAQQSIAAVTADRPSASRSEARGTLVELGAMERAALDRMHKLAEWVYLMDANVDVEYFDNPQLEGRYVLDYVPSFLARAQGSRGHSYLVTSEDDVLIKHAINLFLHPAYVGPDLAPQYEDAHVTVRNALNRLSGRQVFRLVGEPSSAKGAVGIAFAAIAYGLAGLPAGSADPQNAYTALLLIPIDDYAGEWRADAAAAGFATSGHHADLLALGVTSHDGQISLEPLIIEVKNRRHPYSIADLHTGPLVQVERTARLVEVVLGLGRTEERADRELKNAELAELVDYHLRRTSMQAWGADPPSLMEAFDFRQSVFDAISQGNFSTAWPQRSGYPLWGLVLHFNSADEGEGSTSRVQELIGQGGFGAYIPFGLTDSQALLREEAPPGLQALSPWLDPRTSPPERRVSDTSIGEPPSPPEDSDETSQAPTRNHSGREGSTVSPLLERARLAFLGFVGNDPAKERLVPWVARALQEEPPRLAENIAFTGPASTGKTELSRRVAQGLGLPFVSVAGSALSSLDDLLGRMEQQARDEGATLTTVDRQGGLPVVEFPPMAVFIDEAHEMRRPVQEELLTLLEPSTRRAAASRLVADVAHVTFIIATTDWGDLIPTLQTRFQRVALQAYTEEEVAEIVSRRFPQWDGETCRKLAIAGRLIPRQALQRASEFANALDVFSTQTVEDTLVFYYQLWEINEEGLSRIDLDYLRVLDQSTSSVGLSRLATQLGIGEREIERNLEPFLLQLNLIEISTSGRNLTERGKAYLRSLPTS